LVLTIMSGDSRFQPLAQTLQQIAIYSVIPDALRGPQRYSPIKPMDRFGSTWASILRDQPAETWKPDLIDALHRLTGDIEDIKITTVESHLIVRFRHTAAEGQAKWLFTTQESDGTLRVAGILTALLQEPPLPVLAIEEPELTVHPGALPLLYDFLQQASRRCQVIVTTHSPELLDLIAADDIRVVHRTEEGTRVDRMAEDQRQAVRDGLLTLGDVLRTEGLRSESPATSRERLG
jgi:predicted ATPase